MKILAIDTSCDESCVAVLDTEEWKLLSDIVHSHVASMEKFGGVVPEIASREHLKALPLAAHEGLERANLTPGELDWISVTHRPGLIGALLVGVSYAKALAYALSKPFSCFNHIEAHLFSPMMVLLEKGTPPVFPWLALVVSGGHTELFLVHDLLEYEWLGGTVDDAAGEAFDKIGKLVGLPYPAGPAMDQWVKERATPDHRTRFSFPRSNPMEHHFSFSGLKTAVSNQIKALGKPSEDDRLALAASAEEAIVDALVEQIRRAKKKFPVATVVVTGGVACNSRLREKLPEAYFPRHSHCTDNAAMVALLAGLYAKKNRLSPAPWETTAFASHDSP